MSEPSPSRDRSPRKELEPEVEEAIEQALAYHASDTPECALVHDDCPRDHTCSLYAALVGLALKVQSVERQRAAKALEKFGSHIGDCPTDDELTQGECHCGYAAAILEER